MSYKDENVYLFYGIGTSYTLAPLAEHMHNEGYEVIELTEKNAVNWRDTLLSLQKKQTVFITSYHLGMDEKNYSRSLKLANTQKIFSLAPLEIMGYLQPIKNIYYPHDLYGFLLEDEMQWIDLFDLVLLPYKDNQFYDIKRKARCVQEIGWIKKKSKTEKVKLEKHKAVYFPSYWEPWVNEDATAFITKRVGLEVTIKTSAALVFRDGCQRLEQIGYTIEDPRKTIFDLWGEYDLIIADATSSVVLEAAHSGMSTVVLFTENDRDAIVPLKGLQCVHCVPVSESIAYIRKVLCGEIVIPMGEDVMPIFDFETASKLLAKIPKLDDEDM